MQTQPRKLYTLARFPPVLVPPSAAKIRSVCGQAPDHQDYYYLSSPLLLCLIIIIISRQGPTAYNTVIISQSDFHVDTYIHTVLDTSYKNVLIIPCLRIQEGYAEDLTVYFYISQNGHRCTSVQIERLSTLHSVCLTVLLCIYTARNCTSV